MAGIGAGSPPGTVPDAGSVAPRPILSRLKSITVTPVASEAAAGAAAVLPAAVGAGAGTDPAAPANCATSPSPLAGDAS